MRAVVYVVAALAAVGIIVAIVSLPESASTTPDATASQATAAPQVMQDAGTLTMAVPKMHCEMACFPKVKETLESMAGVKGVELDEQQTEGVLDNRQVVVSYDAGFQLDEAIRRLADRGYDQSEVVQ